MKVIIVGRDRDIIEPLANKLNSRGFEAIIVETSAAVLSFIKTSSIQFLLADPSFLLHHSLPQEVLARCPLTRIIALAAYPSLTDLCENISSGVNDYFPRSEEYFEQLMEVMELERERLLRWQKLLLSPQPLANAM